MNYLLKQILSGGHDNPLVKRLQEKINHLEAEKKTDRQKNYKLAKELATADRRISDLEAENKRLREGLVEYGRYHTEDHKQLLQAEAKLTKLRTYWEAKAHAELARHGLYTGQDEVKAKAYDLIQEELKK